MRHAVLVIGLMLSASASAVDSEGRYSSLGVMGCGTYIEEGADSQVVEMAATRWMAGYITAYNAWFYNGHSVISTTDMDGVRLWVKNYCTANPLSSLDDAMIGLVMTLDPEAITRFAKKE